MSDGRGHDEDEHAEEGSSHGVTPEIVQGEIRDFLRAHESRRYQIPRAFLVGVVAGLIAVVFRLALNTADVLRTRLIEFAHRLPVFGPLVPIILGAVGAGAAVWMVRRLAPTASGSGIPHIKAVLHHLRTMRWRRELPVKFLGGIIGIGAGLALGREGPTVQMGGSAGQMVARWVRTTPTERRTLIAAGAGAGLSAAFNAPLAGVVFVLEELQRDFSPGVFTAVFIASVTADLITRLLLGQLPVFRVNVVPPPPLTSLPTFLVLGVTCGVMGVLFNRALLGSLNLFQKVRHWPSWLPGAIVGAGVGLVAWFRPDVVSGGNALAEGTLAGHVLLRAIPFLFVLRFALTMFSYGSGAPGGIFAPLLVLGALIGLGVGRVSAHVWPSGTGDPFAFAAVGMAAYFTAIVRAPLTGVVLILEMTGNYFLMLPLLVACLVAYGIADLLADRPIYEALLERDLLRGQEVPILEQTLLLELPVQDGAPFAGKLVRELGLPHGCLLVTLRRGLREEIPTGSTEIRAGDTITAVIAPEAAKAALLLREGTEPRHHEAAAR